MAHYLVKATPIDDRLDELHARVEQGTIREMKPFGRALHDSLAGARRDAQGNAWWEEVDYCHPPLAAERAAVLDQHFSTIEVQAVHEGEGWQRIADLQPLWHDAPA